MTWQFSVYLLPTFLAGAVSAVLAVYAWRRRDQRAALPLLAYTAGLTVWSVGYGVEIGFVALPHMLAVDKVAFVGSVVVPTAWLLLSLEYAGFEEWITRRTVGLLALEPALTLLLVWTNGAHRLIWRAASPDTTGPLTTPHLTFGPAYWANLGYSYLLIVVGMVLVGSVVVRGSRIYRRQSLLLLLGSLSPLVANVTFNLFPEANPVGTLDLTPFAFAVAGVFYAVALFRLKLLDLAPTARETLVEAMDDGIVVLDADGRVVDCNPAARRALGGDRVGEPVEETVLGESRGLTELAVDGEPRFYEVSETPLSDFRGETVGGFLLLRDITQLEVLRDQEQRLSVLNRVLRHNLRNELTVVSGAGEALSDSLEGRDAEWAERITEAADRMLSIGEKARHVETAMGPGRSAQETVDVATIAREVGDRIGERYPAATVDVDAPEAAFAVAVGADELAVAVENLAENAVEHNPRDAPSVRLRVAADGDAVRLSVLDDGPGIPDVEWSALTSDRESPLLHGSGLGLWLVRWIVEASEGDLSIDGVDHDGGVVTVELPPAAAVVGA